MDAVSARPTATAPAVATVPPRVSAWLADMDDWDADDATVFIAQLDRMDAPRSVFRSFRRSAS